MSRTHPAGTGRAAVLAAALLAAQPLLPTAAYALAIGSPSSSVGTSTSQFLELGVGARPAAMGEAYSAVADDATALYWNPAALTQVPSKSATFMHAAYIGSTFFDYAAYAQNMGSLGAFGAGVQYFSAGSISETDQTGTDIGSFSPNDIAASAGYAFTIQGLDFMDDLNGWSLGIAGKFIESKILATAKTGAADLGVLSPAYFGRLHLALTATNIGGKMTYEQASEKLPMTYRLGSSFQVTRNWLTSLDVVLPAYDTTYVAVGTEYWWQVGPTMRAAARAGYNTQTLNSIDGFSGVSLGVGLALQRIAFDYGFVPYGSVGMAQRLSVSFSF